MFFKAFKNSFLFLVSLLREMMFFGKREVKTVPVLSKQEKRLERINNSKGIWSSLTEEQKALFPLKDEPNMICGDKTKNLYILPEETKEQKLEKLKQRKLTNTFLAKSRDQRMEARFVPNHSRVWFFIDKWNGYYEREISTVRQKEVKDKKGKVSTLVYFVEENGTEHCLDSETVVHVRGYQLEQKPTTWFNSKEYQEFILLS